MQCLHSWICTEYSDVWHICSIKVHFMKKRQKLVPVQKLHIFQHGGLLELEECIKCVKLAVPARHLLSKCVVSTRVWVFSIMWDKMSCAYPGFHTAEKAEALALAWSISTLEIKLLADCSWCLSRFWNTTTSECRENVHNWWRVNNLHNNSWRPILLLRCQREFGEITGIYVWPNQWLDDREI